MSDTAVREQPIISFREGATGMRLVQELPNISKALADWIRENQYQSPEVMRCSVPAYKLQLAMELLFVSPKVGAWDFCNRLAERNSNLLNPVNFERACTEIVDLLRTLGG